MKRSTRSNRPLLPAFLCLCLATCSAGCWSSREHEVGWVVAVAVDPGDTPGQYKFTMQLPNPQLLMAGGGSTGGGEGGDGPPPVVVTVQAADLFSSLNLANTFLAKELSLEHLKVLVFSRDLARAGLNPFLSQLFRAREIRGYTPIMVALGRAEEFIRSNRPELFLNPAGYLEVMTNAGTFSGFLHRTDLLRFRRALLSPGEDPLAMLVAVQTEGPQMGPQSDGQKGQGGGSSTPPSSSPAAVDLPPAPLTDLSEGAYIAGGVPKSGGPQTVFMGTVVFRGDRQVGLLDGRETMLLKMMRGDFSRAQVSFRDPRSPGRVVALTFFQYAAPGVVETLGPNGRDKVEVKIKLSADIKAIPSGEPYERQDYMAQLERTIESALQREAVRLVERCQNEFRADVFGFGEHARRRLTTWQEWMDLDWRRRFPQAQVNVAVDVRIRLTDMLLRTSPSR